MRSAAPNLNHTTAGPTSPPETPRDTSPITGQGPRQASHKPTDRNSCPGFRPMSQTPNLKPTGNGHHFSYTRRDRLSPRSSGPSSVSPSDSNSDSDSSPGPSAFSPDCPLPSVEQGCEPSPSQPRQQSYGHYHEQIRATHVLHQGELKQPVRVVAYSSTEVNFTVEELGSDYDPEDSDTEDISVMLPHAIEYPRSERSRSRSRGRIDVMNRFMKLGVDDSDNSSSLDSGDDLLDTETHRRIIQQIREHKRRRRMTSGSIGKRTISESIGSDTDNEDVVYVVGADEVGSSARRLRRKLERHSFIFQDPPPPRIDEMDEPPSTDEDDIAEVEIFGKELPYWTMEIDSP